MGGRGNVMNSLHSPYVAAYIYGLNIDENALPIYYYGGKAITGKAVYKEKNYLDEGYTYQLEKINPNDAIWNNEAVELDIAHSGLPEGFIDLRYKFLEVKSFDIYFI